MKPLQKEWAYKNTSAKNELTKIGCRAFQAGLNIGARALYWRKPVTVTGEGCAAKIPEIMKREGVKRVMVVTGRHVGKSIAPGMIAALRAAGVDCVHFSRVEANPTTAIVDEIAWQYRLNACDGFLAVGGGSPIDAAKAAAALIARPDKTLSQMAGQMSITACCSACCGDCRCSSLCRQRLAPGRRRRSPPSSPTPRRTISTP